MKTIRRKLDEIGGTSRVELSKIDMIRLRGGAEPTNSPGNYHCFCLLLVGEDLTTLGEVTFYHEGGSLLEPSKQACHGAGHTTATQANCSLSGDY